MLILLTLLFVFFVMALLIVYTIEKKLDFTKGFLMSAIFITLGVAFSILSSYWMVFVIIEMVLAFVSFKKGGS